MRRVALASALALAALRGAARRRRRAARQRQAGADVLAATPYMGWDTYFALPGGFPRDDDPPAGRPAQDDRPRGQRLPADLARRGLVAGPARRRRATWSSARRSGRTASPGSPATLHANGFKLGVYTDAGSTGCGVKGGALRPLPAGHQHARGVGRRRDQGRLVRRRHAQALDPATQYAQIHQAILNNSSHRPMLLNICNFLQPGQKARTCPRFSQSGVHLLLLRPLRRQQLAHQHRRRRAGQRARSAPCCATWTPTRRSRRPPAPGTGTTRTTSRPTRA